MNGYGFMGGRKISRLEPEPLANEVSVRARAQSILSRGGVVAELPSYTEALSIVSRSSHTHCVTAPSPREPAALAGDTASEAHDAAPDRVQASGTDLPTPAWDDEAAWDDYMRRAFAGEFVPF